MGAAVLAICVLIFVQTNLNGLSGDYKVDKMIDIAPHDEAHGTFLVRTSSRRRAPTSYFLAEGTLSVKCLEGSVWACYVKLSPPIRDFCAWKYHGTQLVAEGAKGPFYVVPDPGDTAARSMVQELELRYYSRKTVLFVAPPPQVKSPPNGGPSHSDGPVSQDARPPASVTQHVTAAAGRGDGTWATFGWVVVNADDHVPARVHVRLDMQ